MKNILVHIRDDRGQADRLAVALTLARTLDAQLTCVQVTPYTAFVIADPLGGMFVSPSVLEALRAREEAEQARIEQEIAQAGITWDWYRFDGDAVRAMISRARLADLVVVSLPGDGTDDQAAPLPMVADVAIHAGAPVLALPREPGRFDSGAAAMVAWNGTAEAAHGLRAAIPFLRGASAVHVVTVAERAMELPPADAERYLARYGIAAQLHEWPRGTGDIAAALTNAAQTLEVSYIVMGAYGHSRLRESILGGVTGSLIARSPFPLLLAR
ncbi:MAG TPA: universal stress protein [Sphingomonadaceae bacterium]|nr:universal stress protein [Sphingomonadaceae bacterium]